MPSATYAPLFSLKEAATLASVPEPAVRKAIETGTIRPRVVTVGRARRYRFRARDLLYLALVHNFPVTLGPGDRSDLWAVICDRRRICGKWRQEDAELVASRGDIALRVDVRPIRDRVLQRLGAFRTGSRRVVSNPGVLSGEPVFEGTRIPLEHITGLIRRGVSVTELRQDYPALGEADLQYAALIATMKANPGRPRKALRLVRSHSQARSARSTSKRLHEAAH